LSEIQTRHHELSSELLLDWVASTATVAPAAMSVVEPVFDTQSLSPAASEHVTEGVVAAAALRVAKVSV